MPFANVDANASALLNISLNANVTRQIPPRDPDSSSGYDGGRNSRTASSRTPPPASTHAEPSSALNLPLRISDSTLKNVLPASKEASPIKAESRPVAPENSRNSAAVGSGRGSDDTGGLGIEAEPFTPALAQRFNLPAGTQGLVVTEVDPAGPAADAGLREGDVIDEVNRQQVRSVADVQAALRRTGAGRPALLLVRRGDASLFLTVRPRR